MSRKVVFHAIQAFPHSCLNRGKDGLPKTGYFGGVRRVEVSSAAWTRAMRDALGDLLRPDELAVRLEDIVGRVAEQMVNASKVDATRARRAVVRALAAVRLKTDPAKDDRPEYLLFVPTRLIAELAYLVSEHIDVLGSSAPAAPAEPEADEKKKGKAAKREAKDTSAAEVPADLKDEIYRLFADASRTPELALFGTFFADQSGWSMAAACQRAWACSTHAADIEFDFGTVVADDRGEDQAGANNILNTAFTSACFYRYLAVDVAQLVRNLGGDAAALEQGKRSLAAFLRAAMTAVPQGKQNSMAAQCKPSFVLVDVREGEAPQLANAFSAALYPSAGQHGGLIAKSILRLGEELAAQDDAYGVSRKALGFILADADKTIAEAFLARVSAARHHSRAADRSAMDVLIDATVSAAFGAL